MVCYSVEKSAVDLGGNELCSIFKKEQKWTVKSVQKLNVSPT